MTVNRIAKWDGSVWSALASGGQTGANSYVYALTNDGSENVYAGGLFTTVVGMTVNHIAKWNGSAWSALASGGETGVNNNVGALTNDGSGNLYVGGDFTTAGGINPINHIAKWNGFTWSALVSGGETGVNNNMYSLCILPIIESITAVSTTAPRFEFKNKVLKPRNKPHTKTNKKYR
jgi:hypothetical protein